MTQIRALARVHHGAEHQLAVLQHRPGPEIRGGPPVRTVAIVLCRCASNSARVA